MAGSGAKGKRKQGKNNGTVGMRAFLELLAKKGFDLNEWKNQEGQTLLHVCTDDGELEMVDMLLELKADANCTDDVGRTPLVAAAQHGRTDIVSLLLKHGAKTHPYIFALHEAAIWGRADAVRVLVEAGADIVEEDDEGFTPARNCVLELCDVIGEIDASLTKGRAEALSIILQGGGDFKEIKDGLSLLHDAAAFDLTECISVLVQRGLDPNIRSDDEVKRTPLHRACYFGNIQTVRELKRLGANMDVVNNTNGCSPIFEAVIHGHDNCLKTMIDLGASIVSKDKNGFTPLHMAAAVGQMKCAYLLLEAGAPVSDLSNEGYNPLMVCMKPDLLPDSEGDYDIDYGPKNDRARVAKLFMEMDAVVDDKVLAYAGEEQMNDVIADSMKRLRNLTKSLTGNSITIGNTLLKQSDEVVYVKLVYKNTGKVDDQRYKINTQLMQYLSKGQVEDEDERACLTPSADKAAPSNNALLTLLDPGSRGFKEKEEDAGTCGNGDMRDVRLKYDGSDFTKDGFGMVVAYLTTGRVNHLLVNQVHTAGPSNGETGKEGNDSAKESDDGGCSSASRKRKRTSDDEGSGTAEIGAKKRRCLFDGKLAGKALQAAGYFCLEGMMEEVKRLMDIYGFEIEE